MTFLKSKNIIYIFLIASLVITACSKSSAPKPAPTPDSTPTGPNLTPVWPSDADVYFVGISQGVQKQNVATYWKNGVATVLSSGDDAIWIAVSGNDVFVIGQASGSAGYWKMGWPVHFQMRAHQLQMPSQ